MDGQLSYYSFNENRGNEIKDPITIPYIPCEEFKLYLNIN